MTRRVAIEEVRSNTVRFRNAIERCRGRLKAISLKHFPLGSCSDVSDMLGMYLREACGVECEHVSGQEDGHSHAWLELGGITVDITADQFQGNEAVIVSDTSDFHRRFDINSRRTPHIGGACGEHLRHLKHDYRLLVVTAGEHRTDLPQ